MTHHGHRKPRIATATHPRWEPRPLIPSLPAWASRCPVMAHVLRVTRRPMTPRELRAPGRLVARGASRFSEATAPPAGARLAGPTASRGEPYTTTLRNDTRTTGRAEPSRPISYGSGGQDRQRPGTYDQHTPGPGRVQVGLSSADGHGGGGHYARGARDQGGWYTRGQTRGDRRPEHTRGYATPRAASQNEEEPRREWSGGTGDRDSFGRHHHLSEPDDRRAGAREGAWPSPPRAERDGHRQDALAGQDQGSYRRSGHVTHGEQSRGQA